jgi:hypothetical protein
MGIDPWRINTDNSKSKYYKEHPSQYYFVHHKYHTDWPGIEPKLKTGNRPKFDD